MSDEPTPRQITLITMMVCAENAKRAWARHAKMRERLERIVIDHMTRIDACEDEARYWEAMLDEGQDHLWFHTAQERIVLEEQQFAARSVDRSDELDALADDYDRARNWLR